MRCYERNIPKEPIFANGSGMLVFYGGAVFLYGRGDSTNAFFLFTLGLLCTYLLLGYRNKFMVFTDDAALYLRERSVLLPFVKAETRRIPFGEIETFRFERGPSSNYGPEVYGETVAVLTTAEGEERIFSRWLTHNAYRELLDLMRSKFPEESA
jgi:hypothetical protein